MKYFGLLIFCETKKVLKTIFSSRFKYLSVLLCLAVISSAQEKPYFNPLSYSGLEKQVDSIVSHAIQNEAFPGCVVYAARQDSVLFFKSYGFHTYDSLINVKKSDVYDLASITKIAGATLALMKLYDDGLIHLDEPINTYVDRMKGDVGKVSLREALAHQGGLYPWIPFHKVIRKKNDTFKKRDFRSERTLGYDFQVSDSLFLSNDFYEKRIKKLIKRSEVVKNPSYRYSGLFFYLVPEMVQNLTGVSMDTYLQQHFYHPLSANTLGYLPTRKLTLDEIPPTEVDTFFRMLPIHGQVHDEGAILMRGVSGNAGLFGNAEDLAKVMHLLVNEGRSDTIKLLSYQTIQLFTTIQYPNQENRRGLGFDKPLIEYDSLASSVAKHASSRSFGHSGYTGTLTWADPENELIYIFLSNRVYPTRNNRALYQLNVRPTIHQLIYDYLESDFSPKQQPVQMGN